MVYLLASLIYHKQWLSDNFTSHHPLFQQRVWTSGIMNELADKVVTVQL